MSEFFEIGDHADVALITRPEAPEDLRVCGFYSAICHDAEGNVKWEEPHFDNVVTTLGKNYMLDNFLAASAFTASIKMGLCGAGTKAAADTQASHAGWNEVGLANAPTYTGNRPTPAFANAASAGAKTQSTASSFSITSSGTVAGCFLNFGGSATIDNTTGTLFSAGDFGASRTVANGDTITVTYTLTLT